MKDNSLLRAMVDLREVQIQKARIQFGNRLSALQRLTDDPAESAQMDVVKRWMCRFEELERELDADITAEVRQYPIFKQVVKVKGIGPMLAAKLVALIDINQCDTVSSLWRYAGYAVIDGQRERPTKGEKLHYNGRLRTACYLIATSFLRSSSPYRRVYDSAREYYAANRPDWTEAHRHNAAMRKMIKMFLSHLYMVWRETEGLPVRNLYVEQYLGHEHITSPKEFGW